MSLNRQSLRRLTLALAQIEESAFSLHAVEKLFHDRLSDEELAAALDGPAEAVEERLRAIDQRLNGGRLSRRLDRLRRLGIGPAQLNRLRNRRIRIDIV